MPWVEIDPLSPNLEFNTDGEIKWNTGLQLLMGDPKWVEILYDAANNYLGIRPVNAPSGFPVVAEPEGSEFKLHSISALAAAGVTISETTQGPPEVQPVTSAPGTGPSNWYGYEPIYYLTLPT